MSSLQTMALLLCQGLGPKGSSVFAFHKDQRIGSPKEQERNEVYHGGHLAAPFSSYLRYLHLSSASTFIQPLGSCLSHEGPWPSPGLLPLVWGALAEPLGSCPSRGGPWLNPWAPALHVDGPGHMGSRFVQGENFSHWTTAPDPPSHLSHLGIAPHYQQWLSHTVTPCGSSSQLMDLGVFLVHYLFLSVCGPQRLISRTAGSRGKVWLLNALQKRVLLVCGTNSGDPVIPTSAHST